MRERLWRRRCSKRAWPRAAPSRPGLVLWLPLQLLGNEAVAGVRAVRRATLVRVVASSCLLFVVAGVCVALLGVECVVVFLMSYLLLLLHGVDTMYEIH